MLVKLFSRAGSGVSGSFARSGVVALVETSETALMPESLALLRSVDPEIETVV